MTTEERKEALAALIAQHLTGTFHCTRVWEAWNVGTMSQYDFEPVDESDTPFELAEAIIYATEPGWEPLTPEVLARIGDAGVEDSYWVAVIGERTPTRAYWRPLHGTFYDQDESISLRAETITHIMPRTMPEMPK